MCPIFEQLVKTAIADEVNMYLFYLQHKTDFIEAGFCNVDELAEDEALDHVGKLKSLINCIIPTDLVKVSTSKYTQPICCPDSLLKLAISLEQDSISYYEKMISSITQKMQAQEPESLISEYGANPGDIITLLSEIIQDEVDHFQQLVHALEDLTCPAPSDDTSILSDDTSILSDDTSILSEDTPVSSDDTPVSDVDTQNLSLKKDNLA